MTDESFDCAICQRAISNRWYGHRPTRNVSPICTMCELHYGNSIPTSGAFMDRRKARQISALANAIHNTASIKQWEARHGRA